MHTELYQVALFFTVERVSELQLDIAYFYESSSGAL